MIGAVSNSAGTLHAELRHFGLYEYFDVVVDFTPAATEKPDPAIFQFACRLLRVRPREAWFVGDGLVNDVLGAQGADLAHALLYDRFKVSPGLNGVDRLSRPTDLLDRLDRADETAER